MELENEFMKVKDLVARLQEFDPEMEVTTASYEFGLVSLELLGQVSAVAIPIAKRRNRVISIGPGRNRSRVSPPGSSSTSVICPRCSERARGRTAQAGSRSSLNEYSCSIFLRVCGAGRIEAGASRRIDGKLEWFECVPRYRTNS